MSRLFACISYRCCILCLPPCILLRVRLDLLRICSCVDMLFVAPQISTCISWLPKLSTRGFLFMPLMTLGSPSAFWWIAKFCSKLASLIVVCGSLIYRLNHPCAPRFCRQNCIPARFRSGMPCGDVFWAVSDSRMAVQCVVVVVCCSIGADWCSD